MTPEQLKERIDSALVYSDSQYEKEQKDEFKSIIADVCDAFVECALTADKEDEYKVVKSLADEFKEALK